MKIRLAEIPEEGLHVEAKVSSDPWFAELVVSTFESDYKTGARADLDLDLQKTCENISMTGNVEIDLVPSCDRCLENFERPLLMPLHVGLAPYKEVGHEADDLNFSFYRGDEIDVSRILHEMLLLEIPMQYLCLESCKGLCPTCGINLNLKSCSCLKTQDEGPFAVLKKLLRKDII